MDVDIDFPTEFDPLEYFKTAIRASRVYNGNLTKHNVGVYFQEIPQDGMTGFAAIPYKQAQELGYFKIDFLHLSILDNFKTKQEIRDLLKQDPDWSLLMSADVVSKLFQIHRHYDLIRELQPKSVIELADCIALIRPAKRSLIQSYMRNKDLIRPQLYLKPDNDLPYYKKPHAVAYALTIVLQLHLIKQGIL